MKTKEEYSRSNLRYVQERSERWRDCEAEVKIEREANVGEAMRQSEGANDRDLVEGDGCVRMKKRLKERYVK